MEELIEKIKNTKSLSSVLVLGLDLGWIFILKPVVQTPAKRRSNLQTEATTVSKFDG